MNDAFTASSYNVSNEPWAARLNRVLGGGAWCALNNMTEEYLEIDLGQKHYVTGISTQGKHGKDGKWVTEYTLLYKTFPNSPFIPYQVNGTTKVLRNLCFQKESLWECIVLNLSGGLVNSSLNFLPQGLDTC